MVTGSWPAEGCPAGSVKTRARRRRLELWLGGIKLKDPRLGLVEVVNFEVEVELLCTL